MKQSFIRQGTCVVCTNMTCGKPQKVGVTRAERYVMNTKAEEPLLNVDDRKISASFGCRNPQSFYAGLCALCVGICIGIAITAAIVATGGAAAVAAAALLATKAALIFTAGVVVGSCLAYAVDHDCDETLACEWQSPHTKVKIEGQPALLNGSYMMCSRQGRIEIILNEQTAIKAADYISSCNNKAFWWQVGSQAIQGVFTGMAAGATGPVGFIEMNINVGIYYISEYDTELGTQATRANIAYGAKDDVVGCMTATETARESKVTADATRNAAQSSQKVMDGYQNTVKTAGKTASKPGRGQTAAQLEQSKAQKAFNIEQGKHGTLEKRASQAAKTHKNSVSARNAAFKKLANGLALNIATAMLNSQIDNYSNIQEKEYIDAAEAGVKAANELDQKNEKKNNIFMGIVANQT